MANQIKLKQSIISGTIPDSSQLLIGELGFNAADRKLFTKDYTHTVIELTNFDSINGIVPPNKGGTGLTNPGAFGNVLTSHGDFWVSQPPNTFQHYSDRSGSLQSIFGNNRGINSVDLQVTRYDESSVAAGSYSALLSGINNKINPLCDYSIIVGGLNNWISGGTYNFIGSGNNQFINGNNNNILGGQSNYITADHCSILSGLNNTILNHYSSISSGFYNNIYSRFSSIPSGKNNQIDVGADYSVASGLSAFSYMYGQISHSNGLIDKSFNKAHTVNVSQYSQVLLSNITSNELLTEVFLDSTMRNDPLTGQWVGLSKRLKPLPYCTWAFTIKLLAKRVDVNYEYDSNRSINIVEFYQQERMYFEFTGMIDKLHTHNSLQFIGPVDNKITSAISLPWDAYLEIDNDNGELKIKVKGETNKNIYWLAKVELIELSGEKPDIEFGE